MSPEIIRSSGSKFDLELCPPKNEGLPQFMGNIIMCEIPEMEFLMQNPFCLERPGITIIPYNFV